jgi:hypothetical protein
MDPNAPAQNPVPEMPAQPAYDPYANPWTTPPAKPANPLGKILGVVGGIGVVIVVIIGIVVASMVLNPSQKGQVIFTTDLSSSTKCNDFGHQVKSITLGDTVYANFMWKHKADESGTLVIARDGVQVERLDDIFTASELTDYGCYTDEENLSDLFLMDAGTYKFTVTTASGEVIAEGTLTVNPAK